MTRPFRFGVNLLTPAPAAEWRATCRRAEDLGYDVLLVPDHLGMVAPFPALVAAAEATERPRLGTFVLNAGFLEPGAAGPRGGDHGRADRRPARTGPGPAMCRREHEARRAAVRLPRERVDHLERTVAELERLLGSADHQPRPAPVPGAGADRRQRRPDAAG